MFDIKDDILLIFLLLSSLLTSLDIRSLMGYLLLVLVHSLHTTAAADKKRGKDNKIERDKHATLYMKSATTPVWVRSSKRKHDTDGRVCAFDESWRVTGGTESKRTGAEKPFVL